MTNDDARQKSAWGKKLVSHQFRMGIERKIWSIWDEVDSGSLARNVLLGVHEKYLTAVNWNVIFDSNIQQYSYSSNPSDPQAYPSNANVA